MEIDLALPAAHPGSRAGHAAGLAGLSPALTKSLHPRAHVPVGRKVACQLGMAHKSKIAPTSQPPGLCQVHLHAIPAFLWPQG